MILHLKKLDQVGDTIVEVMIVLAILSLAFGISYATADKGLAKSQDAEEHSQALGIISSQVELVRYAVLNQTNVFSSTDFCMNSSTPVPFLSNILSSSRDDAYPPNNYKEYPAECTDGNYHESVSYNTASNYFDFIVRWNGTGGTGPQQEELTYRISQLAASTNPFADGTTITPPPNYDWYVDGSSFNANDCTLGEPALGDGRDGCFTTGSSMYAWRQVDVKYQISSGSLTNGPITSGPGNLTINYAQYNSAITTAAYAAFNINIEFYNSSGVLSGTASSDLPNNGDFETPGESQSTVIPVTVPANTSTIEIDWTNNYSPGGDPNIQINYLELNP